MKKRLEEWNEKLGKYRFYRFVRCMVEGYLDHEVGKSAAALAYYFIFSFFPLLIFLSALVGFLDLGPLTVGNALGRLIPTQILEMINAYLQHVTQLRSGNLLAASLIFTLWLPMRAVDSLMKAVNLAYDLRDPRPTVRHQLVVALFTLFLMVVIIATMGLMLAGRSFLTFLSRYIPGITPFIDLWSALRFPMMGGVFFLALGALYWVAPGVTGPPRRVFPGSVAALGSWLLFSLAFSFYVENVANYSVVYGALGGIVVMLLWLYATAIVLITGAEMNHALEVSRKEPGDEEPPQEEG